MQRLTCAVHLSHEYRIYLYAAGLLIFDPLNINLKEEKINLLPLSIIQCGLICKIATPSAGFDSPPSNIHSEKYSLPVTR